MQLADAVVLVTGASGEIGAAVAAGLQDRGARLIVSGRDETRLAALAERVAGTALPADLSRPGAVAELAVAAEAVHGRVDAVVHCAGLGFRGPAAQMTAEQVDRLVEVNLRAPVQLTRALLPAMLRRGRGHHSYVASVAGWTGVRDEAVYAATKAGLITFADSLAGEVAGSGVAVSIVSPGAVGTRFFDRRGVPYDRRVPRPVPAERVAAAVLRGIEDGRAHQMVPRWLAVAPAVRTAAPSLYRRLQRRFG